MKAAFARPLLSAALLGGGVWVLASLQACSSSDGDSSRPETSAGASGVSGSSSGASGGGGGGGGGRAGSSAGGDLGSAGGATGGAGAAGRGGSGGGGGTGGTAAAAACVRPVKEADQPKLLSATGCINMASPAEANPGLLPYSVNSPLWSDGAEKHRFIKLPAGSKIHVRNCPADGDECLPPEEGGSGVDDGHWALPDGTVLVKSFSIGGKLIETRLFIHFSGDNWKGFSYEWNEDESEATLLPNEKDRVLDGQTWSYPSREDCLSCHTEVGGRSLGLTTAQLNATFPYADGEMNQIAKFKSLGWLDAEPKAIAGYVDPYGTAGTLDERVRSYMHSNCAICHRPGGKESDVDLRFGTPFAETDLCNQEIIKDTGTVVPRLRLVPGKPAESALSFRMHDLTFYRMPKFASSVVDERAVKMVDDWISAIPSCPGG